VDPTRPGMSVSTRQRRELLKRPPLARPRRWARWTALALVVPSVAAALLLLLLPSARQLTAETGVPATVAAATGARDHASVPRPGRSRDGAPSMPNDAAPAAASPLVLGEPRPLDRAVFPVGVRRIVLDPGHGGKDVGSVTPDGAYEKDITLDIALRLRDLLRAQQGIEVLLTREKDDKVLLAERARFANDSKADLFLSIHLNWLEPATNRGVETFYLGPTEDPFLVQLTSRENRESGYSLADVRRLLDGIYLDLRQQESQQLARSVQRALHRSLREETPSLRDRGIKSAPFLVLVTTEMPAILAEVSCLSNESEAKLLSTGEYRQSIAAALRDGIEAYTTKLTHSPPSNPQKPATGSPT
jgi:N-acetylmuramoyl-L-alanine amidase